MVCSTVQEKLLKLMENKLKVGEYKISKVVCDYYEVYQDSRYDIEFYVEDLFSSGLEIKV